MKYRVILLLIGVGTLFLTTPTYAQRLPIRGHVLPSPHARCLEFLRGLMADDPPHVPSFFMAGQHLTKQDRIAEARDVLRVGIEQARQQGNTHAAGEMSEFLAGLGSLGE
ncbi:MAG: hypothetical protein O3C40_12335 [Planctomycetota bacterium]|nr:hypothetical protein [Planctomycetota bacterium]